MKAFLLLALTVPAALPPAIDAGRQSISLNFYDEPKTLDAQRATDVMATMILGHVGEGLTRLDPGNQPFAAQAESWEIKDKTHYTFKLRATAAWSDGKPVTAQDFVFAWRRAVDPRLASEYAFIMFPVKNARAISEGKVPPEQLGVRAKDAATLEVELERPTGHFLKLLSETTYFPAREDVIAKSGAAYATGPATMVFNGPYVIASWNHGDALLLKKNETYWNRAAIQLTEIAMPRLVRDKNAEYDLFKKGSFALTWSLSKELLPRTKNDHVPVRKYNGGTVWYFQFNTARKVTGNQSFRKAIQMALNREEFVTRVQGIPGSKPIYGIIPEYVPGVHKRYGEEYPLTFPDAQLMTARKLLKQAKQELGVKELPPLAILASDSDDVRRDMAYFQRYFKEQLDLAVTLDFEPLKARLERTDHRDFDIVNSGWGPDYLDAMTFADLFTSWNKNNSTGWNNQLYDDKIAQAMESLDPKERLDLMSSAEKILVDEAPVVPYFQQFRAYVQDPHLVGVVRRTVGADPDFYYAKITK